MVFGAVVVFSQPQLKLILHHRRKPFIIIIIVNTIIRFYPFTDRMIASSLIFAVGMDSSGDSSQVWLPQVYRLCRVRWNRKGRRYDFQVRLRRSIGLAQWLQQARWWQTDSRQLYGPGGSRNLAAKLHSEYILGWWAQCHSTEVWLTGRRNCFYSLLGLVTRLLNRTAFSLSTERYPRCSEKCRQQNQNRSLPQVSFVACEKTKTGLLLPKNSNGMPPKWTTRCLCYMLRSANGREADPSLMGIRPSSAIDVHS